jgi:hypothetical protein
MNHSKFPRKEADMVFFAHTMIGGYTANPGDFPHADPASLQVLLDNLESARQLQVAAKAAYQAASTLKQKQLEALQEKMKSQLKLSEVDCHDVPVNLEKIGWSARKSKSKSILPGQPLELRSVKEGFGTIELDWQSPYDGGMVRAYVVYRRDVSLQGKVLQNFTLVGTAFKTNITLKNQPRGIQLEYIVKAVNIVGESPASSTVEVVL